MSNRYARVLAAGGAAVLAATLAAPALAATTWTIQPGGAITAKSGTIVLKDTKTGTVQKCTSSTASGTLKSGSGLAGTSIGKITSVTFKGPGHDGSCSGPGGPLFILQAGGLPWHVNLASYDSATGVVTGTITHLHIAYSGNGCTAAIDGTGGSANNGRVRLRYADSTGQLTIRTAGGNLHWYDVSTGCLGIVNSGDPATLSAAYTVTPKQTITSP